MWVRIHVREREAKAEMKLCVAEATQLKQLRELIALRLAQGKDVRARRRLSLKLVFEGQLLQDDEKPLGQMGVVNGSLLHCLPSLMVEKQQLSCFPHRCSVDGGRVVHVLGERFPSSARLACRFGRVVTEAQLEDDGGDSGVSQLRCTAPPHPAGPVTISVSFDGGASWLEGPSFWYYDPAICYGGYGLCVPADCGAGALPVRTDPSRLRWDPDRDPEGGPGCA
ncbi:unnamed protein product [Effrenium voratum]|nr:unnamed protein product [Effrenium voratum]